MKLLTIIRSNIKAILLVICLSYILMPMNKKLSLLDRLSPTSIVNLPDIEPNDGLRESKEVIIDMIIRSDNIINKEELIDRVNKVSYKYYREIRPLMGMDNRIIMLYYHELHSDIDYIILKDLNYIHSKLVIFHELAHLVYTHRKIRHYVPPSHFIQTNYSKDTFTYFFKDWYNIDVDVLDFSVIKTSQVLDKATISIGDVYYNIITDEPGYYISESELYSRLLGMKLAMVDRGIIDNMGSAITTSDITILITDIKDMINSDSWVNEYDNPSSFVINILDSLDWVIYLPIIDYSKIDYLDLMI